MSTTEWSTCVAVESPYNGTPEEIARNVRYAVEAMHDCLRRGEAPFLSHLLYTQEPERGFVSDDDPNMASVHRDAAIDAGCSWAKRADKTVVYEDLGITRGMKYGIESAKKANRPIEYRQLTYFRE